MRKISNELLVKLYYKDGLSLFAIGKLKKISRATLYGRMRRLGLKLRSIRESGDLKRRKNLDRERSKLREVLLRWNLSPDDCLLSDLEIDGLMDRIEAIGGELKAPVGPRKRQEAPVVKADALTSIL
jgi:predicted DNA-binding protein YlxM (UPF0122 family)